MYGSSGLGTRGRSSSDSNTKPIDQFETKEDPIKDELQEWTGHSHWFSENLKLVDTYIKNKF